MWKNSLFFQKLIFLLKGVQFSIIFSFFTLMGISTGSVIVYTYFQYTEKMSNLANDQVDAIADETLQRIVKMLDPVNESTKMARLLVKNQEQLIREKDTTSLHLIGLLEALPQLNLFAIGT